jgi:hypothetical protein
MGAIYGEAGPAPSAAHRDRALELLAHRGHGAPGGWSAPGIVLGARGSGPAVDHTGQRCAVLDGAILNERALRVELGCTAGGAALVLHAFERWGNECLERFNGMFAIALWDGPSRALWLARDRVGERPLSYLAAGGRIVFASEIKAILVDERIDRRVDPRALAGFLTFANSGSELTMFEGIRKLAPGHWLRFADRVVTVRRWWDVDVAAIGSARQSETQLAGELRDLLEDAVRLRVTSEAPVGAFLSGGVDSAAVTALMRRHSGAPVHTFTLAYEEGGVFDELEHMRAPTHGRSAVNTTSCAPATATSSPACGRWSTTATSRSGSPQASTSCCSPGWRPSTSASCSRATAATSCSAATAVTSQSSSPPHGGGCHTRSARRPCLPCSPACHDSVAHARSPRSCRSRTPAAAPRRG